MTIKRKYELMILLNGELNNEGLKTWIFNYAKVLRKFSVCDISVISRGRHNLTYSVKNQTKGSYIQLIFFSAPKYVKSLLDSLKLNSNVLRFLIFTKI